MTLRRALALFAFFVALAVFATNLGLAAPSGVFGMLSAAILTGYAWAEFRRPAGGDWRPGRG